MALSGREQGGRRRGRLDRGGPRLGREEQGREALLGDDAPFSNLNFFVKNRQNFFAIELMNIH